MPAQAHDFEAYQELPKQQTGENLGAGERYEAISVFLSETEDYLNKHVSLLLVQPHIGWCTIATCSRKAMLHSQLILWSHWTR